MEFNRPLFERYQSVETMTAEEIQVAGTWAFARVQYTYQGTPKPGRESKLERRRVKASSCSGGAGRILGVNALRLEQQPALGSNGTAADRSRQPLDPQLRTSLRMCLPLPRNFPRVTHFRPTAPAPQSRRRGQGDGQRR